MRWGSKFQDSVREPAAQDGRCGKLQPAGDLQSVQDSSGVQLRRRLQTGPTIARNFANSCVKKIVKITGPRAWPDVFAASLDWHDGCIILLRRVRAIRGRSKSAGPQEEPRTIMANNELDKSVETPKVFERTRWY